MTNSAELKLKRPDADTGAIRCEHPDCGAGATHRAPKARHRLNDYYWFCIDHVREYNRCWNYYAGMNDHQVESEIRNDTVWRRPTWPFGTNGNVFGTIRDDLGVFEAAASTAAGSRGTQEDGRPRPDAKIRHALKIMDFNQPVTLTELKSRYKKLVKQLHPDANGGDKLAEDKLKDINLAYAALRKYLVS